MRSFALLSLLIGGSYALPKAGVSCVTVTTELIVPTTTYTFPSTDVETQSATTARNLGTYTEVHRVSSTKTLETITSTATACSATGTITHGPTKTVYTTHTASPIFTKSITRSQAAKDRRALGLYPRQTWESCTVTSYTATTTYGVTETYLQASETSTYTAYTDFSLATVTRTSYGGTAYAIATAKVKTTAVCGPTIHATAAAATSTVTQDARCAPSALLSAHSGFGLEYASDTPASGASFQTTTSDPSQCCQLCAETEDCATSSWDIRTNVCRLQFPVNAETGMMSCGQGLLAYYDAGPLHPMTPGSGLYVAELCGSAEFGSAKPDDGT